MKEAYLPVGFKSITVGNCLADELLYLMIDKDVRIDLDVPEVPESDQEWQSFSDAMIEAEEKVDTTSKEESALFIDLKEYFRKL